MADITVDDVIEATFKVLEERGDDFVYEATERTEYDEPSCKYSVDGGETGSCLFGAALIDKLGVPYNKKWDAASGQFISRLLENLIPDAPSDPRVSLLGHAQSDQDRGVSYGRIKEDLQERLDAIR